MCTQYGSVYGRKLVAPAELLRIFPSISVHSSMYLRISHTRLYRDMTKRYIAAALNTTHLRKEGGSSYCLPGPKHGLVCERKCLLSAVSVNNCPRAHANYRSCAIWTWVRD